MNRYAGETACCIVKGFISICHNTERGRAHRDIRFYGQRL